MGLVLILLIASDVVAIRCEKILTMGPQGAVDHGILIVRDGKIAAVGADVEIPDGARVIDLGDGWAMPGMIDLHCHIGGSMWDINEMGHPRNPELSTKPTIDPDNEHLLDAVAGGVTTVLYIPGSGTNLGGFGVLMKTGGGRTIEDLLRIYQEHVDIVQAVRDRDRPGALAHLVANIT